MPSICCWTALSAACLACQTAERTRNSSCCSLTFSLKVSNRVLKASWAIFSWNSVLVIHRIRSDAARTLSTAKVSSFVIWAVVSSVMLTLSVVALSFASESAVSLIVLSCRALISILIAALKFALTKKKKEQKSVFDNTREVERRGRL